MAKAKKYFEEWMTPKVKSYEVLTPLRNGEGEHEPGDSIDMLSSEADELVEVGALVELHSPDRLTP